MTTESPKTTLEILKAGLERIKRGWCKGSMARTAEGIPVSPRHPNACMWCAVGAINGTGNYGFDALLDAAGVDSIVGLNDQPTTTQADIIALYERAIAAEEAKVAK